MHPFLDVSKLTDDEIIERLGKAYLYMNAQKQLGHVPTVQSILDVIESLEEERNNRMAKIAAEEQARKVKDPYAPIELGKLEE